MSVFRLRSNTLDPRCLLVKAVCVYFLHPVASEISHFTFHIQGCKARNMILVTVCQILGLQFFVRLVLKVDRAPAVSALLPTAARSLHVVSLQFCKFFLNCVQKRCIVFVSYYFEEL